MKTSLIGLGALVACTAVAPHAIAGEAASPAAVADSFVHALQHQRFEEAAAMFGPATPRDSTATADNLKRIDDGVGGFATMYPVAMLPNGKSVMLAVLAHKNALVEVQKFLQFRYESAARDGQPVFYELNVTADSNAPQVLSFALHFPASDAQSEKRAAQLMSVLNR